jgi:HK97 family phage major capsid protein
MSTPFSTPDAVWSLAQDVKGVAPQDVIPSALILTVSTKAGNVEGDRPSVRVPFIKFDSAGFIPEGNAITESSPVDSEIVIHTGKVATLVPVSREEWGQPDAANLLKTAVQTDLVRKANRAFLAQTAPVGPAVTPPAGLIHQSITSGGVIGNNLDAVADAIAGIEDAGGSATHILAGPLAWAELVKRKTATDSNVSLLGAGADAVKRQLLSLPVLVSRDVPSATLIVLDRDAVLSVYGQVEIATSTDYYFNSDSVAVRATFRFGATVSDPARVVKLSVLDGS